MKHCLFVAGLALLAFAGPALAQGTVSGSVIDRQTGDLLGRRRCVRPQYWHVFLPPPRRRSGLAPQDDLAPIISIRSGRVHNKGRAYNPSLVVSGEIYPLPLTAYLVSTTEQ